jgi:DsbC/DsbD-like thiol-disulfide interchange protein
MREQHSAVRLIAGRHEGGAQIAGIAFQLQPGWKTYWRTPGDSGVPPRFDFSASDNIETVTVLWPAPSSFDDGAGGTSFGYKNQLLLPLRIIAKKPDSPVTLRAVIDYAVCEKLCVPVEARAEVTFTDAVGPEVTALAAALQALPQPAHVGDPQALTIESVSRDGETVTVDVRAPEATEVGLFAEGPSPDWALPPPKLRERTAQGLQRFAFDLSGRPSGAQIQGAALKLTLSGGGRAYEFDVPLP